MAADYVTALERREQCCSDHRRGGWYGCGQYHRCTTYSPALDTNPNPNATNQTVTLTLMADNDVTINSGVTIRPAGADAGDNMGVTVDTGGSITNNGIINVAAGLGGAVNLTAMNDIALVRINAGAGDITITATTGAISDNPVGEGAGNENLVGGNLSLTAGSGIGVAGDTADIDTAANRIDARTTSGGIYITETDAVTLGNGQAVTAGNTLTVG